MNKDKHILVVGGGTAGWMAASLLNRKLKSAGFTVSLLESSQIETIGVGEGSTPYLAKFFSALDIAENEWMTACNATFKTGIRFLNWSSVRGSEQYFHPFYSLVDFEHASQFEYQTRLKRHFYDVEAHPDKYFLAQSLSCQCKAPKATENFPFKLDYAYHFDAARLAQFLKEKAISAGVQHLTGTVDSVKLKNDGDIESLHLADGRRVQADFFCDCTGFRSLLMQQNYQVKFISYQHRLLNDAAVALPTELPTEIDKAIPSATQSYALSSGWAWQIPLTNRYGNGYVYSSAHITAEQAEAELKQHLGLDKNAEIPARHLKMRVGRLNKHWQHNCIAIGLSQGFIEPLEATALHLVQYMIDQFITLYQQGGYSNKYQDELNHKVNRQFDNILDYVSMHYLTNSYQNSSYWQDARRVPASEIQNQILNDWHRGEDLAATLTRLRITDAYSSSSWHCLLAGSGYYRQDQQLRPIDVNIEQIDQDKISDFIRRCSLNYPDHNTYLKKMSAQS
ncbi:tryptophan halogenase family protein [Gayadomonas joobiniege]|uniref:tryptophan halogenase family protein n=1 Tax=Gayadomonas joobiniege TaxID=1234606 RepID=UPI000364E219|nr:tryptophan halogenase family protein [Gayadomonas joobiniege]